MTLLERITRRLPRGAAVAMLGIAGLFGMRTPPDPEVVAQTAPRPRSTGSTRGHGAEEGHGEEGNFRRESRPRR